MTALREALNICLAVAFVLAACGDSATPPPTALPAPRVEPAETTAPATEAPAAPTPLLGQPSPTDGPSPTPEPCVNDSEFLSDLTVPDDSEFAPGEEIDKRWEVRNSGTCAWGPDYRLVLVDGNSMGAANELALYPAAPGATAVVQVNFVAPAEPGDHIGAWQMRDPELQLFGDRMWIRIKITGPTPTP